MGGRIRLMNLIRRQDYYRPLMACLAQLGITDYQIKAPTGRGHPILKFRVGTAEHRVPLPGTPSGHSDAKFYLVNEVRRRVADTQPKSPVRVPAVQRRIP